MKPLFHPSIDDVSVASILHALSDPTRVRIFAKIACGKAAPSCSSFLHSGERNVPKSTLSQHFKALREAGLLRGERSGLEIKHTSRCGEIEQRFPGLIAAIINAHRIEQAANEAAVRDRCPAA